MGFKQSAFTVKLMIILAVGVLVLGIGLFCWHRQNVNVNALARSIKAMNKEMDAITLQTNKRKKYLDDQVMLKRQLASIDTQVKDYQYLPTYLEQLQDVAAKTGNVITRIKPDDLRPIDLQHSPLAPVQDSDGPEKVTAKRVKKPVTKAKGKAGAEEERDPNQYQVQQIDLEVRGSYVNLLRFIEKLRTFPKLVYVRSVSIAPQRAKDQIGAITAKLDTYVIITPGQYQSTDEKPKPTRNRPGGAKPAPAGGNKLAPAGGAK